MLLHPPEVPLEILILLQSLLLLVRTVTYEDLRSAAVRKYEEKSECRYQQRASNCAEAREAMLGPARILKDQIRVS